ncbi:MAG: hypothetical protein J6M25_07100 [Prevotella sp.]|nr:hypothetical protein [Prevotella sp.]
MKKSRLWTAVAILTVCTITTGCGRNSHADRQQYGEQRTAEISIEEPKPAFEGIYLDENSSPSLIIERMDTAGMCRLEIGIFRLTTLSDAVGKVEGDRLEFTATDAAGNPIGGNITLRGDTATVTFTHSTWALIETGTQFQYVRQKALQSKVTAEMAYQGVSNYCHSAYDWSAAEENPDIMGLEMGEETDSAYHVVFRSYTGALVNFYVDKADGTTRMVEYVPALNASEEAGTINLFDYLK